MISYVDSEVKIFHPLCEDALNQALKNLSLNSEYEVLHHQYTGTLEMDYVVRNRRTKKYLCVIEVKRTPADVQSTRYQVQAQSYVQMNSPENEKPFYILTNLEKLISFRYDTTKPRVYQQMLLPGLENVCDFSMDDEHKIVNKLAKIFTRLIDEFRNDRYQYLTTLEQFLGYMNSTIADDKKWKSSMAMLMYEYIRGAFRAVRLSEERKKEERLTKINTKQTEIIEQISLSKERIFEKQRMYYELGQQICGQIQLEKDELSIMPKLSYNQEKLQMFVDSYLNARNPLAKAMQEADIIDNESLINVLTNAFDNIVKGIVPLKGGKDKKQAAVELLSTNYYYFMYNVVYQGDTLSSMSEGKKAFVILRLLLDFDENKYPILIDQPEDDLDNRAIYNDLVTYIRNKKLERQIILVTHNPNITVGTDAEEIIVANQHGAHTENQDGVKFEYRSGAIENSYKRDGTKTVLLSQGIREHVCDLLEGGDIAFKKRESKYGLKK